MRKILLKRPKFVFFLCLAFVMVVGVITYIPTVVSISNNVNGRELPIYSVETDKPLVALSFDSAWGDEYTQQILDILAKHKLKVTFFMTGGWVESFPDDVKAIHAAGHDLGNHSENHKNMSQLTSEENKEELLKVHSKVIGLTNVEMDLFRPPYGDYDDDLILDAKDCGYYTIQWSVDTLVL